MQLSVWVSIGHWLTAVGGLLAIAGAFLANQAQNRLDLEKEEAQKSHEAVLMEQRRVKEEELLREIGDLRERGSWPATGGDSYAEVFITPRGELIVHAIGDYPLYDVAVRVVDEREVFNRVNPILEAGTANETQYEVLMDVYNGKMVFKTDLMPANMAIRTKVTIPRNDHIGNTLEFKFSARNGTWHQTLRFERFQEEIVVATRLRFGENHALHENGPAPRIDPTFPRLEDGEIEWQPYKLSAGTITFQDGPPMYFGEGPPPSS